MIQKKLKSYGSVRHKKNKTKVGSLLSLLVYSYATQIPYFIIAERAVSHSRKMDIIDDVVYETKKGREKHQEAKTKRKQALDERMKLVKERVAQQKAQQKQHVQQQQSTEQTVK